MSRIISLATVALLLLMGAASLDESQHRKDLAGLWKGFAVEGKGENPDRGPVKLELTFTEKTIHGIEIKGEEKIDHGTGDYNLKLADDPRCMDGVQTNERGRKQEWLGIYTLDNDTLKWCVGRKERPTTFETKKGQFLLVLKRQKAPAQEK